MKGITKPSFKRLARRAGVKRMSGATYEECTKILGEHMKKIMHYVILYGLYSNRKTIKVQDVVHAFERDGMMLYGF